MLPQFPLFRQLKLEDKPVIEKITSVFPPYSDFNFTSLWSYNTEDDALISLLNNNLVVRFRDYLSNIPFYTFIGNTQVTKTTTILLDYVQKMPGILKKLQLIPEHNVIGDKDMLSTFHLQEDRDNFDYILSVEKMAKLPGTEYEKKRNKLHKFQRISPTAEARTIDLSDTKIQNELIDIFHVWEEKKGKDHEDTEHELIAFQRLLKDHTYLEVIGLGVFVDNKLQGFSTSEVLDKTYAIYHFVKANPTIPGIFEYIYNETAKVHLKEGCSLVSREQDLGIEGLREAKMSWRPIQFLKKYIIAEKKT